MKNILPFLAVALFGASSQASTTYTQAFSTSSMVLEPVDTRHGLDMEIVGGNRIIRGGPYLRVVKGAIELTTMDRTVIVGMIGVREGWNRPVAMFCEGRHAREAQCSAEMIWDLIDRSDSLRITVQLAQSTAVLTIKADAL